MTGTELLAMLKAHPKACKLIGVTQAHIDFDWGDLYPQAFEDIILGKTTRWCDEHDVEVCRENTEHRMWYWFYRETCRSTPHAYDTRLAANLAAMEAHP